MRKIVLSVFSTVLVIGLILGVLVLYVRGHGFNARERPSWDLVSLIRRLPKLSPEELKRLQETARNSGGELSEQAGEPEKNETGEVAKEETKPKHTHTHMHKH